MIDVFVGSDCKKYNELRGLHDLSIGISL